MKKLIVVLAIAIASARCGGKSPTEPACINLAGTWQYTRTSSCGTRTASVVISQSSCRFTVGTPDGTLFGEIQGGAATTQLDFGGCGGTGSGTVSVSANQISGAYSYFGSASCCQHANGRLTLTR